jgi:hypothetical protein
VIGAWGSGLALRFCILDAEFWTGYHLGFSGIEFRVIASVLSRIVAADNSIPSIHTRSERILFV